jgi:RNA polymerase sigma factor (sigma-70 family)
MAPRDPEGRSSAGALLHRTESDQPQPAVIEEPAQRLRTFLAERRRLLWVAYRVVGDSATAEDVVQDTWLRWQRMAGRTVTNPAAWLTTATTHLAINVVQSARYRRETPTDSVRLTAVSPVREPAELAERAASIDLLLALLMTRLTAAELAACMLRKCFAYPYPEIADILRTSTPNARQLVRRSQVSIAGNRTRQVDAATHRRLAAAFTAATVEGDMERLETLLADHARGPAVPRARAGRRSP